MGLNQLVKVKTKVKKRLGRGVGSGKGKTAGRGTKGQKARGKIPATFSGDLALYKKLPLRKGLGNPKISPKPKIITLADLNKFKAKSQVGLEDLIRAKLITEKQSTKGVKVLATGEIKHALVVKLPVSEKARLEIERKGGKVDV